MKYRRILLIPVIMAAAMACSFTQQSNDMVLNATATTERLTQIAAAPEFTAVHGTYVARLTAIAPFPATQTAIVPTRTAIALTRHPELAVSTTPHPLEQTATAVLVSVLTSIPPTPQTGENDFDLTATQIVAEITQTAIAGSQASATPDPNVSPEMCATYAPYMSVVPVLADKMNQRLNETMLTQTPYKSVPNAAVAVEGFGVNGHPGCAHVEVINSQIIISFASDLSSTAELTTHVEDIVALLANEFPLGAEYGLHTRLHIEFYRLDNDHRGNPPPKTVYSTLSINTDYQNARDAYNEGLRGAELIEALGGWIPDAVTY